jgi:hypothetical protein
MASTWLIPKRIEVRTDDRGEFDELVVNDEAGNCVLHAEMMDDKTLWLAVELPGLPDRRAVMWVNSGGKLKIRVDDD